MLVVVAHPDDESFGCGSLLALAAARGVTTTVVCATRGEAGEATIDLGGKSLAEVREGELRRAAALLGVSRVEVLDWRDSGLTGATHESALVATPLADVALAIARIIDDVDPDLVITLDASDGHRDHAHVRDATLAAVEQAGSPAARVYLSCLVHSLMQRWVAHLAAGDPDSDYLELGRLGTPDEQITTVIDSSEVYDLRWQAIRTHRSQTSPFEIMPPDLQRAFLATEHLRRIRPPWHGGPPERDLFAPTRDDAALP